tara:strand:- start:6133 stop:7143 length:1011 start_codon:yes stop_codon:yes gene_type:complete
MATLKQMQARKNMFCFFLLVATIVTCYFAYTKEDVYFMGILGSLLYAAPVALYALIVAVRIRWQGKFMFWPLVKFSILVIAPLVLYGRLATSTPNDDIAKEHLRIATYNVLYHHKGSIDKQIEVLEKLDADILSLLEVNEQWEFRLKDYSQTYPFTYKVQDKRANDTVGLSMILSKYPLKKSVRHDEGYITEHYIALPHKVLSIVQIHALPPLGKNLTEKRNKTLDIASNLELGEYKIFLGDFNAVHWQKPIEKILLQQGLRVASKGTPTWPVPVPAAPIDHILTSFNLSPSGSGKICVSESDHCLIYVDINLNILPAPIEEKYQEDTTSPYSASR